MSLRSPVWILMALNIAPAFASTSPVLAHKSSTKLVSLSSVDLLPARDPTCETVAEAGPKGFFAYRAHRRFEEVLNDPRLLFQVFQKRLGPFLHSYVLEYAEEDPQQSSAATIYRSVLEFLNWESGFVSWLESSLSSTKLVSDSSSTRNEHTNPGVSARFDYGYSRADITRSGGFRLFTSARSIEELTQSQHFTILYLADRYTENGSAVGQSYDISNGTAYYLVVRGDKLREAILRINSFENLAELQRHEAELVSEGIVEAIIGWHNPYRVGSPDMVYTDKATQEWSPKGLSYQGGAFGRDTSHYMAASFTKIIIDAIKRARPAMPSGAPVAQP